MTFRAALPLFLLSAWALAPVAGQDTKEGDKAPGKHAGLERFKQLAGDWVGKEKGKEEHESTSTTR